MIELRTIEIKAEIELPARVWWEKYGSSAYWSRLEKELLYEARELEDFIHDHRSRDAYQINIVKKQHYICSFCGEDYGDKEPTFIDNIDCCNRAQLAFVLSKEAANVSE